MVSILSFMIFLLVLSTGCGLLTAEQEAEKVPPKAAPAHTAEKPPPQGKSAVKPDSFTVKSRVPDRKRLEANSLTPEDIRRLQVKLKASGFDPGPIDGILGPKTKSAFLSLQSGCSELMGLTDLVRAESPQPKTVRELTVLFEQPAHRPFTKEEIQRTQLRLKQSGFDPGPLDGILGPKTNAALLRAKAGCSLTEQFPLVGVSPTVGNRPVPIFTRQRETSPASNSSISAVSFDRGKIPILADMSAGVDDVRALQIRLKNAGFDPGPLDGIFGPRTMSALQRYRASNGVGDFAGGSSGNGARMEY